MEMRTLNSLLCFSILKEYKTKTEAIKNINVEIAKPNLTKDEIKTPIKKPNVERYQGSFRKGFSSIAL
jgi:hypothetical protein